MRSINLCKMGSESRTALLRDIIARNHFTTSFTFCNQHSHLGIHLLVLHFVSSYIEDDLAIILVYLNKLFQIQLSAGDIIQFESGNTSKFYMLSATGTWDEIIKLQ
jgi:hypothetical protein